MTLAESDVSALFKQAARAAERYRAGLNDQPQRPGKGYATLRVGQNFPTPESGISAQETLDSLIQLAEPGLHASPAPRFFGWVIGGSHPVGVAADWLTSAWGQNCGNHVTAPSAAFIEEIAARWLLDILHLPPTASVGFVTGATMANFVCLAAARTHVLHAAGWDVEADGMFGAPEVHVLIGRDAHTSVFSALRMLGWGHARLRYIDTDAQGAMNTAHALSTLAQCTGPAIIVAQAGQINTGAFDPIAPIVQLAHRRGAWVHVDGAFGLWARACPEKRGLTEGYDTADSWATDGHKWLQTPYDCGYAVVAHPEAHRRAMTSSASYLPTPQATERNPAEYVPELSRRARGFATWAMLRHFGREGIAAMVAHHCALARHAAQRLAREPGVAVLNDVVLNQVIVQFGDARDPARANALTRDTIAQIVADGTCFVSGAEWRGRWVMRLSIIGWSTQLSDVDCAVEAMIHAWQTVARRA
jgi:glutamate/tyrosine decarboxylase-like PLP-dependent enzyme